MARLQSILEVTFNFDLVLFTAGTDFSQVFTKVTKEMSRSGTPTLPFVLPMYAQMEKCLTKHAQDEKTTPDIRNAAAAGLIKLQEYYSLAKECHYVVLATGKSIAFFAYSLHY